MQGKYHRLFVALWPDESVRDCIRNEIDLNNISGKLTPSENWHITLAFLGDIENEQYSRVVSGLRNVKQECFEFCLDTTGFWEKPGVAWLGCGETCKELLSLHLKITQSLESIAYKPDHQFLPHLTLSRKSDRPPVAPELPIRWQASEFVLVESKITHNGSEYRVRERFPLL